MADESGDYFLTICVMPHRFPRGSELLSMSARGGILPLAWAVGARKVARKVWESDALCQSAQLIFCHNKSFGIAFLS